MADDLIRYDILAANALRGVVRTVLIEVAATGLPGEHHFFINFDTTHPDVRISSVLRARYPKEMTIVMQHQFWDLHISESQFEVGLSFGGVPEKLVVPFAALKGFFDPSVNFALQFEPPVDEKKLAEVEKGPEAEVISVMSSLPPARETDTESIVKPIKKADDKKPDTKPGPDTKAESGNKPDEKPAKGKSSAKENKEEKTETGAEIVSLDSFRKK
jgi:uncharacterized protein